MTSPIGAVSGSPSCSPTTLPYQATDRPPFYANVVLYAPGLVSGSSRTDKKAGNDITISQSNCLTFNGVDDSIAITQQVISGDFTIKWRRSTTQSGCVVSSGNTTNYLIFAASKINVSIAGVYAGFENVNRVATSYTLSRVGTVLTLTAVGVGSEIIDAGSAPDFTISQFGATGASNPCSGQLYGIDLDGVIFPCAEGSGSTIYDTTGTYSGTISTSDINAMWAGRQDTYHYNVTYGWWESSDSDGIFYPANPGGGTFHPGGKWNGAESKYTLPAEAALITQDNLEGHFWFTAGSPNAKTQAEITAYVSGKSATFLSTTRGLCLYDQAWTGDSLTTANNWFGAATTGEYIMDGTEYIMDGTEYITDGEV